MHYLWFNLGRGWLNHKWEVGDRKVEVHHLEGTGREGGRGGRGGGHKSFKIVGGGSHGRFLISCGPKSYNGCLI